MHFACLEAATHPVASESDPIRILGFSSAGLLVSAIYKGSDAPYSVGSSFLVTTMSKAPCHFYHKPGGCRYGAGCKFAHMDPSPQPNNATASTRDSPEVADSSGASTASTVSPTPPGTCLFYWKTGDCKRGFQCRYKHQRPSDIASTPAVASPPTSAAALLPFLTSTGASRLLESGSDALFGGNRKPKSPSEVHNYLKMYLREGYQFRNAFDMHSFLALLSDATSSNSTWVSPFV